MDDLPPPAYSEQELDQKISAALEASLNASQPSNEWEEWDEAKFEAATRRLTEQTTSSSSRLYSEKCAQMESVQSWKKTQSTGSSSHTAPAEPSCSVPETPMVDDEDDHLIPPPPFTPVGPSLDGPPFEDTIPYVFPALPIIPASSPASPLRSSAPPAIQYESPITSISPPVSPLRSPAPPESSDLAQPELVYRHSMPVISQNLAPRVNPRPVTTYAPVPRVDFNTSMAYNKQPAQFQQAGGPVDVSALYKSVPLLFQRNTETRLFSSSVSAYLRPVAS